KGKKKRKRRKKTEEKKEYVARVPSSPARCRRPRVAHAPSPPAVARARRCFFSRARRQSVSLRGEKDRGDAGNYVKDDVWHALIVAISNAPYLQGYCVRSLYKVFQTYSDQVASTLYVSYGNKARLVCTDRYVPKKKDKRKEEEDGGRGNRRRKRKEEKVVEQR
ncbi:hypothetical protein GW17_00035793, partial [Ensete ventricosum]